MAPRDPDLRKKLAECEKEAKRLRFEEALSTPVRTCADERGFCGIGSTRGQRQGKPSGRRKPVVPTAGMGCRRSLDVGDASDVISLPNEWCWWWYLRRWYLRRYITP